MCNACSDAVDRRRLLTLAAAGAAAAMVGTGAPRSFAADGPATTLTADEALAKLKDGNGKYVADPQLCTLNLTQQRTDVSGHQAPWASILSCADSRVPPELIFGGLGLGELFVARNAGNLADTATIGTLEYGAAVLGSPLIVVLGHTKCGAVAAACDVVAKNATFPGSIGPMIQPILPAALAVRDAAGDFVANATVENAKRTAARLTAASPVIGGLVEAGKVKVAAALYDLASGKVSFVG
ncbi:MAG: carbonic anhydrase [Hyphomicrobiales bacterium]